jgi:hypothetical protein
MEQSYFNVVARIKKKIVDDVNLQKDQGEYQSDAYSTVS